MARIIRRCLLILAFTAAVASSVLETTVSDASAVTHLSKQPSSSAPDDSSHIEVTSSYVLIDNSGENSSHSDPATKSSKIEVTANAVNEFYNNNRTGIITDKTDSVGETTTSTALYSTPSYITTTANDSGHNKNVVKTDPASRLNVNKLYKSEFQDTEEKVPVSKKTLEPSGESEKDLNRDNVGQSSKNAIIEELQHNSNKTVPSKIESSKSTSEIQFVSESADMKGSVEATTVETAETKTENRSYSEQNTVPLVKALIDSSSSLVSYMPEIMYSSTQSQVQIDGKISSDLPKRATRKRSLNSTNTDTDFGEVNSTLTLDTTLPFSESSAETTEVSPMENKKDEIVMMRKNTEVPLNENASSSSDSVEFESEKAITHGTLESETTSSDLLNGDIHSIDETTTDHVNKETHSGLSTTNILSTSHEKTNEKQIEKEYDPSTGYLDLSESGASSVTFDPNGMTNNYTQDPDSVTFQPKIFHVDKIPTDVYLSRLETSESTNNQEIGADYSKFTETATQLYMPVNISLSEKVSNFPEREREFVSSPNPGVSNHHELDIEEMVDGSNTKKPVLNTFSTYFSHETHTTSSVQTSKHPASSTNYEMEEMMNDAPYFIQNGETESNNDKITNVSSKTLEMNVSNDIDSTTVFSSQNTAKTTNKLDFSVFYLTEQSALRPVTIASPFQTSESLTILPDSFKVESELQSEAIKSEQPASIFPDTSSPIIMPNPAPSIVNQSIEATTIVLQPDSVPEIVSNRTETEIISATNSTIAGVAVKTSVSVSLPVSTTLNDSMISKDQTNANENVSSGNEAVSIFSVPLNNGSDSLPSTDVPTESPTVASTSGGLKIRKPKLKITATDVIEMPRTRKPFLQPPPKASSTAGPPVSIFGKSRTRGASITSSTTSRPLSAYSTIRIQYASRIPGMVPNGELVFSIEPVTTTVPTTTETEEPFSDEPFNEITQIPIVSSEDDVTLIKVAGYIVLNKGLRWTEQMINRHSLQYKTKANFVHLQLDRLFRSSAIAPHLWKIQIDGFSGRRNSRAVAVDFFLYLIKSGDDIQMERLTTVFHEKLDNSTFSRFTVDTSKTSFEFVTEEPLKAPTPPPEKEKEPLIPQWAIAVIVVGAASLIFIILFAAVAILGRHHVRRRYSNKLDDEESDRPGDWESKMAAAYENLAADTIYDTEDMHGDTYKKSYLVD